MDEPAPREIRATVALDAPLNRLRMNLQRTLDLAAFGLRVSADASPVPIEFKDVVLHFKPAVNRRLDIEDARAAFEPWVIGCSFRDAIEAVGHFLEDLRVALAAVVLLERTGVLQVVDEQMRTQWLETVERTSEQGQRFHALGFPGKLRHLIKTYGEQVLSDEWTGCVSTINAARNCLVHRRGVVGPQDVRADGALRVAWIRFEFLHRSPAGEETPIAPPVAGDWGKLWCDARRAKGGLH